MLPKLAMLGAVLLWGVWGVAGKVAVDRAHPYAVQWMYTVPQIALLPIWFLLARRAAPGAPIADGVAFAWATGAAVCSVFAALLMRFAMVTEPASTTVAVTATYPVVTLALALLMGLESFSVQKALGMALTIAGVAVMQWPEK